MGPGLSAARKSGDGCFERRGYEDSEQSYPTRSTCNTLIPNTSPANNPTGPAPRAARALARARLVHAVSLRPVRQSRRRRAPAHLHERSARALRAMAARGRDDAAASPPHRSFRLRQTQRSPGARPAQAAHAEVLHLLPDDPQNWRVCFRVLHSSPVHGGGRAAKRAGGGVTITTPPFVIALRAMTLPP